MNKEAFYTELKRDLNALIAGENNFIATLSNASALLFERLEGVNWVGFYLMDGTTLVLGPFQGPVACTRIAKGKGVCGSAWQQAKTLIVPDVDAFPGHIACSSLSRSEIVVPLFHNNTVIGVLDVDSERLEHFDDIDAKYLGQIVGLINFNA